MSERSPGATTPRVPGVAQVTSLAAPPAVTRGLVGQFVVAGVILVVLAVAAGWYFGRRVEERTAQTFDVFYDAWGSQGRLLEEAGSQLTGLQRQLEQWAALDEAGAGDLSGVLVISRGQAAELVGQARSAVSQVEALRRLVTQRQSLVGRASEELRREVTASLWAALIFVVAAAVLGGAGLARASSRPISRLRRDLETADQSAQALASALGPWFSRAADALAAPIAEAVQHREALEATARRVQDFSEAARAFAEHAGALQATAEEFGPVADHVRDFGDESKVLALSTAIEAARMEGQATGVGVVAEEIRRLAAEAREMVRRMAQLRRAVSSAAERAAESSRRALVQAQAVAEGTEAARERARQLAESVREVQDRLRAAARAASTGQRSPAGRGSLELRMAVDRALGVSSPPWGSSGEPPAASAPARTDAAGGGSGRLPQPVPGAAARTEEPQERSAAAGPAGA